MKRFTCVALVALAAALSSHGAYQMENLNRGVVAVRKSTTEVYVGWRLFGTDPSGVAFNLYRSANGGAPALLNASPLTATTDFVDTTANVSASNAYFVAPVIDGVEQAASTSYTLPANAPVQPFLAVALQIPPGGTTPDGVAYTYNANDASVADLDGDGELEIILKWDPSNSKDNSQSGYTGNVYLDAYKLNGTRLWRIDLGRNIRAGAHYTQFQVYDYDGDGKAELMCKTADATVDGTGVIIGDPNADWRNSSGYILSGPEFLTVFEGSTGRALHTTNYIPARGTVSSWGDSYGNRVDRFLAGTAYLDGVRPSAIFSRGYYTRTVVVAWDWNGTSLAQRWVFDSNVSGTTYEGRGNHQLSIADVDGDGRQEIIFGALGIDEFGSPMYTAGYHGDALHVGDFIPTRAGLEAFKPSERTTEPADILFDARTGSTIWSHASCGCDNGRGVAGDIYAGSSGAEAWSSAVSGLTSSTGGTAASRKPGSTNFLVWWDADPVRELLNSNVIDKYGTSADTRLLTASECSSNNGTKSTPALSGDILGDWREEVIWRKSDNTALHIYTTTIPAVTRLYTLLHNPMYRVALAWQNTAYNQPPHPDYFLGDGMSPPPAPNITLVGGGGGPPPNSAPSVSITSPTDGATFATGSNITIEANASDSDGTVAQVEFFQGSVSLGVDTSAPYAVTWTNVPAGTYSLTARATDDGGAVTTSSAVSISVSTPGADTYQVESGTYGGGVTIDSNNAGFNGTGFANFPITDGFLALSNVDGNGGGANTLSIRYALGVTSSRTGLLLVNGVSQSITFAPSGSWTTWTTHDVNITLNNNATNVIRFESNGDDLANLDEITVASAGSPPPNSPPTVSITSPADGATFTAGSDITIDATAADSDGTVAQVEFFHGATSLGIDASAPYSVTWANVPAGNYTLTAIATDDAGAQTTSVGVSVSVTTASPPAAPTNLVATAAKRKITLTWSDNSADETAFKIERTTDNVTFAQIATVATDTTSYTDSGLTSGTTYYYRVRATSGAGDSAYSNTAGATAK